MLTLPALKDTHERCLHDHLSGRPCGSGRRASADNYALVDQKPQEGVRSITATV
jgi:hypothetical protein